MRFSVRVAIATASLVLVSTPAFAATYPDPSVQSAFAVGGAQVSALALDPDGQTVASVAPNTPLPPASTMKLLTVGTALHELGANWRYHTKVVVTANGDLVLVGAGDPTLTQDNLKALAEQVAATGRTKFSGTLRIDDSLFDRTRGGFGWRGSYVGLEAGPLSAFMVDHNMWGKDPGFRKDPLPASLKLWRKLLKDAGVSVAGRDRIGPIDGPVSTVVAEHVSAPLRRIAQHTLQTSNNTEAEMLLKTLDSAQGHRGTTGGGVAKVKALAQSWGITLNGRIVDGSGLSRADRLDAKSLVGWMQSLETNGMGSLIRQVLPVSCKSGTLKKRLCGNWLSGRVTAKTGMLDNTAALAGWATSRSGATVAFAVIVSGPRWIDDRNAVDRAMTGLLRSTKL